MAAQGAQAVVAVAVVVMVEGDVEDVEVAEEGDPLLEHRLYDCSTELLLFLKPLLLLRRLKALDAS